MLDIRIRKSFSTFTLDVRAVSIANVLGIVGPSGSGKTTLLNCIAGIIRPDAGSISLDGKPLFDAEHPARSRSTRKRGIGYVFQDGLVFPHMSVAANIEYGRGAHGAGPELTDIARVLELQSLLDRRAQTLSGGEARRVAIGRALASGPRVLLMDEPLTGLHPRLARVTLAFIRRTLTAFDVPTVYVSHAISDIIFLCDDTWVLSGGKLVAQGSPRATLGQIAAVHGFEMDELDNVFIAKHDPTGPKHFTTCIVGDQPLLAAEQGPCPADSTGHVLAAVHSRDIILSRSRPEKLSARNILHGTVESVTDADRRSLVTVDVGVKWLVQLTRDAINDLEIKPGASVFVIVKASAVSIARPTGST